MKRLAFATAVTAAFFSSGAVFAQTFSYNPPGDLVNGSGQGRVDNNVYAPNMRYPVEEAPSFLNSQVWGVGGSQGPSGSQCDDANFSYPWWDNYCETRQWDMPLCPSGTGHQGQDIRAKTCDGNVHWVVAAEAGTVTNIGSYSVYVMGDDGTRYDYLHMGSVQVDVGQEVAKGERIGKVSNEFGGTSTTVHLHFNLRQDVQGVGNVYVPTYLSLVTSYQALIGPPIEPAIGTLEEASCAGLKGWAASPSDLETPIEARLYFDGERGDGETVGHPVPSDLERADLCDAPGPCASGFEIAPPLSLFDGVEHTVRAYGSDGTSTMPELEASPKTFQCDFEIPTGVRRRVGGQEVANAWRFSAFWDTVEVSDGVLSSLEEASPLDAAPRIVSSASDPTRVWLIDGGVRRLAETTLVARAWDLHVEIAEVLDDAALQAIPEGKPLRPRPIVLASPDGELWLVDEADASEGPSTGSGAGSDGDGPGPGGDGCDCRAARSTDRGGSGAAIVFGLLVVARLRRRRIHEA